MSDDETWANLTNGTGQTFPEVTLEDLANTARWMRWCGAWGDIGLSAALWLLAKRQRKS